MERSIKTIILTESQIRYCIDQDKISNNNSDIIEKVNNNFTIYLKEEYGVKQEISNLAQELSDYFFLGYDKQKYRVDKNGVSVAYEKKYINFFGRNILIICYFFNFSSQELCNKLKNTADYAKSAKCDYNESKLELQLCFVEWNPIRTEFYASVQHELTHMYEFIVSNGSFESDEEEKLYKTIIDKLSKCKDPLKKQLLRCLYISSKSEQIAHANGLDSQMVSNLIPYYSYQNTTEYNYLYELKYVLDNFEQYKGLGMALIEKTDNWIYNRLSKAYRDYSRRLGRVVVKNTI